ncbi:MAG TPA: S1 RNA-binding domain-containing protein [Bryobacteraceae bacterium]|nr:S1 RNA-binding domain-containing protein [Bryobacteraceae bacterium]
MSLPNSNDPVQEEQTAAPETSTFGDILSQYEQEHKAENAARETLQGTVVAITAEAVVVDIGRKLEGVLDPAPFRDEAGAVWLKVGQVLPVIITGWSEGYYELSTLKVKRPTDWSEFEKAFAEKSIVGGRVIEAVKGGLRVDLGVRAFMPASRSGAKDPAELEKLVGQEIRCRITKLDTANEDVVVDRRSVIEEENALAKERAFQGITEGAVVHGTVRTVMEYGAFVDLGGVDGLLHIGDMSWNRVAKSSDVVSVGDSVEVKILKVDPATHKISLGMKQLSPDPWAVATESLKVGDRIKGKVVRLADFGAFVEIQPGVDGLIHLSSMAWGKRVRKPSDVVNVGDWVEAVILEVKPADKRISLSLKEALGDPWEDAEKKFPVGTIIEDAAVSNLAKFGAFVDLGSGLEGMVHIADITHEKRLEHPKELLKAGQKVRALILEVDKEKHRIRLGMKQLEPTVTDQFIAGHTVGETISGRVIAVDGRTAKVQVSEGVTAICRLPKEEAPAVVKQPERAKADLSQLSAMLSSRWKVGPPETAAARQEKVRSGEIRTFKITALDPSKKTVEVEMQ